MSIELQALEEIVRTAAMKCAGQGRGYSQERAVLMGVAAQFGGNMHTQLDIRLQEAILTCWHDLFRAGVLSWGVDLDNPGHPFFHIPERPPNDKEK